jgi:acyl-coenzyme A thioesterase PaaI-like protein
MDGGDDIEIHHGPKLVTEGEFAGWKGWGDDAYESLTGPFFFREEEGGKVRCAFRAGKKHMNGGGAMHGGCMMTFADFCLFALSHPHRAASGEHTPMVTISLNGEFVGPAYEGDLIECTGEVVRAGGSLMFLRGVIETGGKPMLTFSGVIKKVKRR